MNDLTTSTSHVSSQDDLADYRNLVRELEEAIEGEVRFDAGSRALYANDASNYRQPPIGVTIPRTVDDILAIHRICHAHGVPILSRGGGTSLSGETVNHAVVIDHSKYLDSIVDIDTANKRVTVQGGAINDKVNQALGKYDLVFPPDPSTHEWCTIGGNVGNNSCGIHSVQAQCYGHGPRTCDNVHALDILTYDGVRMTLKDGYSEREIDEIIAAGGRQGEIFLKLKNLRDTYAERIRQYYPQNEHMPRRVSGYNLDDLLPERGFNLASALCGTEGTCMTVLHATLKLTDNVKHRTLMVVGFNNIEEAGDHVPLIIESGPIGLEAIDERLYENEAKQHMHEETLGQLPDGGAYLIVEFGGEDSEDTCAQARHLIGKLKKASSKIVDYQIVDDKEKAGSIWAVRKAGLGATAFPPPEQDPHWPGWEDSAVPPDKVGDYVRDLKDLYQKYGYVGSMYGHFGQGCIHSRINFDLQSEEGVEKYRRFAEEAADLVVSYGGSLSGEHGDGQARGELLERMYGPELIEAFREFKRIWDPQWKMNPGKVIDPYRLDENLRLIHYEPHQVETTFKFPDDKRSFARVAFRCVGVGKCRSDDGTMCPSYMVTREEKHTTRGRARLLFEMMNGDVIKDGWQSEEVRESLDLCLACKGCKNDCPVNVDMATYKAEFLSHYYGKGAHRRPLFHYAFGFIDRWSRLASKVPALTNFVTQTPLLRNVTKQVVSMPQQRKAPVYAPQTFKAWFAERPIVNEHASPVMLWADTFSNHFYPDTAQAATEVLEAAGYRVVIPPEGLCCGRPFYDFGMLDNAKAYLEQVMTTLGGAIEADMPIVGLEPSCISVFRDELTNLFPDDARARRLHDNSMMLSDFLVNRAENYQPPRFECKALVHGHCHHKAIMHLDAEQALMQKMGLDYEILDSGCCGMSGSFGFEREKYAVSIGAGERVLLPQVRDADEDTLIITDGFSCREQIAETTDRRALHIAEVLRMAMDRPRATFAEGTPERDIVQRRARAQRQANRRAATLAGAVIAGGVLLWGANRRRQQKRR
ncbi:FAD-binding oxidoreductase [Halomonas sp. McH1-25]|uniref:FAD-binding and (Fe-S)-binding domain-containing protein n=1 Tax=unclassified Halomonas TaxID=2609666 RepID=UPI001EF48A84|nr:MULTISPECIES: FAD-binding and (Fe-S)-binding domain-containing protein [unclassified Halomonas]MCG7600852.1 FAD-binding oxidoreductase [Halomonas sp. McH1-25]MCP1343796.1 FAD-binding oxidoreductase [Halomonas sp. FL8]MCP1360031.1 FAD-binding oxidoreductase [Halomonas sp. BBD45]